MEVDGQQNTAVARCPAEASDAVNDGDRLPSSFIRHADACLNSFPPNFELAVKFLERGLEMYPTDVGLLTRLAGEYAERGLLDAAKSLLRSAIELEPDRDFSPYMQLAQIEEGLESLKYYKHGIALLKRLIHEFEQTEQNSMCGNRNESEEIASARKALVAAHCAVAELHMTDLCENEGADGEAYAAIKGALELDGENAEALTCNVQYLKVKDDHEQACRAATKLLSVLAKDSELRIKIHTLDTATDEKDLDDEERYAEEGLLLPVETRVNACRCLIDVGFVKQSLPILKLCLDEDDEDPQVWMVYACCLYKANRPTAAKEALSELSKRLELCGLMADANHPLCQHAALLGQHIESLVDERPKRQREQAKNSGNHEKNHTLGSATEASSCDDESV